MVFNTQNQWVFGGAMIAQSVRGIAYWLDDRGSEFDSR
jgi:hypothetical protein